jgi:hypothetical protein
MRGRSETALKANPDPLIQKPTFNESRQHRIEEWEDGVKRNKYNLSQIKSKWDHDLKPKRTARLVK